jgi:hypothetical protein
MVHFCPKGVKVLCTPDLLTAYSVALSEQIAEVNEPHDYETRWNIYTLDHHGVRESFSLASSTITLLTNRPATVPTQRPPRLIRRTWTLPNSRSIHARSNLYIPIVRKLAPRTQPHLSTSIHCSTLDVHIVAVLNQDGVVSIVRKIDAANFCTTRLRDTEDAATATTRLDVTHEDVSVVVAVELASFIGKAEGGVAVSGCDILTVDEADVGICDLLEEEAAFANVAGNNGADLKAVNVPGFDAVRGGPLAVDGAHLHVAVGCAVTVKADGETSGQVEREITEGEALGSGEAKTEVDATGHGKVGNLNIGGICDFDGAATALDSSI